VELVWYSLVAAYVLGAMVYFGLGLRTPRCRDCRRSAMILARQIAGSTPPFLKSYIAVHAAAKSSSSDLSAR
jgi:hypothetical protein